MNDTATDGQLLQNFLTRDDQESFRLLVKRHSPMVLGTAGRVLGNHAEAEDVSQATFLALARKAHFFTGQRTVAGWLHRVAWQMALDVRKSRLRREEREKNANLEQLPTESADSPDPELGPQLEAALGSLPEKYRSVLLAHYSGGLTIEQTAHTVGCSPSAASMRLTRGREKLRTSLLRRGIGGLGSVAALGLLAPATVPTRLTAQTLASVQILIASQHAGLGFGVLWLCWTRPVAFFCAHLQAVAVVFVLAAGLIVGLAVHPPNESLPVAVSPIPIPTSIPASTPPVNYWAMKMTVAGKTGLAQDWPLFPILLAGDPKAFKQALEDNRLDLNTMRDQEGRGLLQLAASHHLPKEVALLLDKGANPNLRDGHGRTPLHEVIGLDTDDTRRICDALLAHGADVNAMDYSGLTPLMIAARDGNLPGVQILLAHGADPHPKDVPAELLPVELARAHHHPDIVDLLETPKQP